MNERSTIGNKQLVTISVSSISLCDYIDNNNGNDLCQYVYIYIYIYTWKKKMKIITIRFANTFNNMLIADGRIGNPKILLHIAWDVKLYVVFFFNALSANK